MKGNISMNMIKSINLQINTTKDCQPLDLPREREGQNSFFAYVIEL